MKYKMEFTQDQLLSMYQAFNFYIEEIEVLITEEGKKGGDVGFLEKELFVQKQLRNRVASKITL